MGSRLYRYLSLVGAKLVGRRHPRDVDLPGVKELKNAFVSKSDNAITSRPDFNPINEDLLSVAESTEYAVGENSDDYLNSVAGMYGTGDLAFFSSRAALSWNGEVSEIMSSKYTTGTATATIGSTTVVGSAETAWVAECWPGCIIEFAGDGAYYVIDTVTTDGVLELTTASLSAHSDESYKIYRTHQPAHADYKLNIQPFTSGLIYSSPTITMPVNADKICGPFHANVTQTSALYDWSRVDSLISFENNSSAPQSIASDRVAVMNAASSTDISGYDKVNVSEGGSPETAGSWSLKALPADFEFSLRPCIVASGLQGGAAEGIFYLGGRDTADGNKLCVAITDDHGDTWTKKTHPSEVGYVDIIVSGPYTSGFNIVATKYNDKSEVYISDDDFDTWTDVPVAAPAIPSGTFISGKFHGAMFVLMGATHVNYANISNIESEWAVTDLTIIGELVDFTYITGSNLVTWLFYSGNNDQGEVLKTTPQLSSGYPLGLDLLNDGPVYEIDPNEITNCFYDNKQKKVVVIGSNGVTDQTAANAAYVASSAYGHTNWSIEFEQSAVEDESFSAGVYCISTEKSVVPYQNGETSTNKYLVSNVLDTDTEWAAGDFVPLSNSIRSLSHSVLDGYVMLIGVIDRIAGTSGWDYHPRRVRWSTPLTYNDFSSIGSGSAELDGSGALLDSRAVNGRIVTFESSAIGALSPRGYSSDPWEYDVIKSNIRAISNPQVVDDLCYFIDDSGLMRATNGITVENPPFPFDLTEYDDFNADKPIWLTYSPELESLIVYNPDDANRYVYTIETDSGSVARMQVGELNGEDPKSVVCIENSDDRRLMISFNPDDSLDGDATKLAVAELSTGVTITGKDEWTANADDDTYHNTDVQSGQLFIVPEGDKTGLKHLIVNTYTDGTSEATNPILVVQCRSLEDTEWHDNGDKNGTISVTITQGAGDGTALSNRIGGAGGTTYDTPCLATQARVYSNTTPKELLVAGTDYTVTGTKEITFSPASSVDLYAYWENEPSVIAEVGDMIETTYGWHRVTAINNASGFGCLSLDHYMPTGTEDLDASHHHGTAFPAGEGQIKIGISKLVDGVQLRFLIFHRADGDATVTKITGVSVGHIPAGRKVVEV